MDMTMDEISKLLGEITQGEWGIDPYGPRYSISSKDKPFRHITMVSCYAKMADDEKENKANARLISAAPTIIRKLVEQNKTALARNEELQRRVERLGKVYEAAGKMVGLFLYRKKAGNSGLLEKTHADVLKVREVFDAIDAKE